MPCLALAMSCHVLPGCSCLGGLSAQPSRSGRVVYRNSVCLAAAQSQALIGHCVALERQCNEGPSGLGVAHRTVGIVALSLYLAPHISYVRKGQLDLKHMPYSAYRLAGRGAPCLLHMCSIVPWGWSGAQSTSATCAAHGHLYCRCCCMHSHSWPTRLDASVLHAVFWLLRASK